MNHKTFICACDLCLSLHDRVTIHAWCYISILLASKKILLAWGLSVSAVTMGYDAVSSKRHIQMVMRVWLPPSSGYKLGHCMYLQTPYPSTRLQDITYYQTNLQIRERNTYQNNE